LLTDSGQQTSLPDAWLEGKPTLEINNHGLVRAAYFAYSFHHNLVLRPEDVWFAILAQFSFYVNANAEKLRSSFVAHKGKKGLILRDPGQADMGLMCRNMTKLIDANVTDPELRAWILPSFTTTTMHDEVVASVIMMGTLQKYFDYVFDCSCCGIPSVTLLGEVSDWEDIQRRIEKLGEYGEEPSQFRDLLRPILKHMVATFTDDASSDHVVGFWERIIHHNSDSGSSTLTGWMVAFCFWDEDGKRLGGVRQELPLRSRGGRLSVSELLGQTYYEIDFDRIPAAFISVPVIYVPPEGDETIETKLVAGLVGFEWTTCVSYPWTPPPNTGKKLVESKQDEPQQNGKRRSLQLFADKIQSMLRNAKGQIVSADNASTAADTKASIDGAQVKNVEKTKAMKTSSAELTASESPVNTIQPVSGWWMYRVRQGKQTGIQRDQFYQSKMAGEWNGQASTGYVQPDGETVIVEEGLPKN
jgi:hypothetical protein